MTAAATTGDRPGDWRPFRRVPLPGTDAVAEKTSHGEHHMGAETIEIVLPFAAAGQTSFFTTNGSLTLSADGRHLFVHDATAVLRVDCASRAVDCFVPPRGCYIRELIETDATLTFTYYGQNPVVESQTFARAAAPFEPGPGPVQGGVFPSAWAPAVARIRRGRAGAG